MSFSVPSIVNLNPYLSLNTGDASDDVVNKLNQSLTEMRSSVSTSQASIIPSLTRQQDVQNILSREQARLNDRKSAIDAADKGQKRMVDLTKNATQRNRAMNNLYMTVVIALVVYLAIRQLVGIVPELVIDIMMILLVAGTLLTLITMYYDYNRRNNMDFEMINLGEPSALTGGASTPSTGSGLLQSRINGNCVGEACCPEGTTYNEKYAICVPNEAPYSKLPQNTLAADISKFKYFMPEKEWKNPTLVDACKTNPYSQTELACVAPPPPPTTQGFTTMLQLKTSDMAKPNDPFEFGNYNLYK
jgi:hypothetical protein